MSVLWRDEHRNVYRETMMILKTTFLAARAESALRTLSPSQGPKCNRTIETSFTQAY